MAVPNLALRGSTYWWRSRITVAGHIMPLALSLRTGVFHEAKVRAGHLSAEVEKLRMAYGERGKAVDPATLKKIFSDAMRWQLERILLDQTASGDEPGRHAAANLAYAEMWRLFTKQGGQWTADDDERLAASDWPPHMRLLVADLWEEHRHRVLVSGDQMRAYEERFGFAPTTSNRDRVRRTVFSAREAACREAVKHLGSHPGDFPGWVESALADEEPFAFGQTDAGSPDPVDASREQDGITKPESTPEPPVRLPAAHQGVAATVVAAEHEERRAPKKLLNDAAEECIAVHVKAKAWSADSVEQVRAAIRLFDFACGSSVFIEDLEQRHVGAFYKLCGELPNRWGKTKAELERGLPASLEYAEKLKARGEAHRIGFSGKTMDKHITWIQSVLSYADDEDSGEGH